jgi:hypothetical protein
MMVKARAGQGGPALARYLMEGKNEHAELLELRNMDAPSLQAALFDMDMLARGSQCHTHALHVQMRAAPGERLSASHWREACDRYAEAFGMEQHQAAIILHHQQDGATHAHFVFNRVHPETLIAADLWRNYEKHKTLAREMEQDWGLQQVSSRKRDRARDYSNAGQKETEQARRTGENVHDIREHVRWLWEQSANGPAFAAALEEEGYQLAKGDRRGYVVLDPHGSPYSLGSRTTGAKAREVREKLGDLDPASVPDIEQARRLLSERQAERRQQQRQGKGEARAQSQPTPEPAPDLPAAWWQAASKRAEQARTAAPEPAPRPEPTPEPAPAPSPTAAWLDAANKRADLHTPAPRFYASPRAERRDRWEDAAAKRLQRLRNWQALEREQQQRRFTEAAKLERGDAVKAFNTQQRHDLTHLLYKEQAEALAGELQRQQERREQWDKPTQRREPRPRTYPPTGFKAYVFALFRAKAAAPAPTPAPARPLADAEPPEKTPEESLLESLRKQEEERKEEKCQHKGRARSPVDDLLGGYFRKGPR